MGPRPHLRPLLCHRATSTAHRLRADGPPAEPVGVEPLAPPDVMPIGARPYESQSRPCTWHERDAASLGFHVWAPAPDRPEDQLVPATGYAIGDSLFGLEAYPGREGPGRPRRAPVRAGADGRRPYIAESLHRRVSSRRGDLRPRGRGRPDPRFRRHRLRDAPRDPQRRASFRRPVPPKHGAAARATSGASAREPRRRRIRMRRGSKTTTAPASSSSPTELPLGG